MHKSSEKGERERERERERENNAPDELRCRRENADI